MSKRGPAGDEPGDLRRRAEARLASSKKRARPISGQDALRLVHELEVHQIELELQNEQLVMARNEVVTMLVRYNELFDFAPLGYAVLSLDETIQEINHLGASLLGRERASLIGASLAQFVVPHH